ncbi:MAG: hypothetical protein M1822_009506 [Bathelium mastoideum]|nr:MAG: hypothetical protein M1822_009506 [Bathelium mastoideum]
MGWGDWLWGSSQNQNGSSKIGSQNPVQSLDPNLREYLEKETPKSTPKPPINEPQTPSYTSQLLGSSQSAPASTTDKEPLVPSESLFPDGRYANLWKTYRPQGALENANKTPQEKLQDIVDTYKERKAAISRAALENCTFEKMAITECYLHGSWMEAATMCRVQNRALDRCYTMQAKFLKALGYLSAQERSPEEEERIQMHADKLYHQMLDQERLAEEAKNESKGLEKLGSDEKISDVQETLRKGGFAEALKVRLKAEGLVEATQSSTKQGERPPSFEDMTPEKQAIVLERLKGKSPEERDIEIKAISGEMAANEGFLKQILPVYEEDRRQREQRRQEGKETMSDKVKTLLGLEGPRRKGE